MEYSEKAVMGCRAPLTLLVYIVTVLKVPLSVPSITGEGNHHHESVTEYISDDENHSPQYYISFITHN